MDTADNLNVIRERILQAAERGGRRGDEIRLLAVSKTVSPKYIEEAFQAGQRSFAENRVQELMEKVSVLDKGYEWHLIGRLQSNKVKYLTERIILIHSLDRISLMETLEEYGSRRDHVWQTLIQVNTARDPAKAGLLKEEVSDFLTAVSDYPHIQVQGLMTIGALDASPKETREFFRELRVLRDELSKKTWTRVNLKELSMGMSKDFELAIEEGSTIVRVGSKIFGTRKDI